MLSTDDYRRAQFWRPNTAAVTAMLRVEREDRTRVTYSEHFTIVVVYEDTSELERATLVAETLSEIIGASPGPSGRAPLGVRRARAFLHDGLGDKISLDELAAHAGLDKFHLVRAFRREVGLPPYEYLTQLRISRARELLRNGRLVADVAQALGFYDESQLHRHFRRIVGVTPGAYARAFVPAAASTPTSPKPSSRRRSILSV